MSKSKSVSARLEISNRRLSGGYKITSTKEHEQKQYAYHPNHEDLAKCIGNDMPHFCLSCGEEFEVDSLHANVHCPHCTSTKTVKTNDLEKQQCTKCKKGTFKVDTDFFAIS